MTRRGEAEEHGSKDRGATTSVMETGLQCGDTSQDIHHECAPREHP